MLTAPLKQTPEYKRLLAGMAGAKPAVVALFGMPPTARAQMLAALCEDTGRSALVVCAGEADATRFAEDAAVFGRRAEVFPARDYVLRPVEGQSHEYEYRRLEMCIRDSYMAVKPYKGRFAESKYDGKAGCILPFNL